MGGVGSMVGSMAGAPRARLQAASRRPSKRRILLLKLVVWALCLLPIPWGLHRFFLGDGFGANPIQEIEHYTGHVTLTMLLVLLSVTPLRRLSGWNDIQKVRRLVGLFAFFYVCLHFMAWIGLDQFFAWSYIGEDIAERPYVLVGFTAFLLLLPMAVTSTKGWIRRLGKNWVRLHRAVYVASVLGIVHYFWVTKADDRWPTFALCCWIVLMAFRVLWTLRKSRSRSLRRRIEPVPEAASS